MTKKVCTSFEVDSTQEKELHGCSLLIYTGAQRSRERMNPEETIDNSPNIRELVENSCCSNCSSVHPRQEIDVNPDDKLAAGSVLSILKQYANGVSSNLNDLWRVLDHLQIRSWNEYNDEINTTGWCC
uniref:Uncharacterized protein n=1 Tax=Nelumbo nucifera TaxID=4432 RepID=A0A822XYD5_NELNU|nr:TPA_asm: hypothetical protein HUJ06_023871 [Nelumbo nucifera]